MIASMTPKSFLLTDAVATYLDAHNPALDAAQTALISATQALGSVSGMQIAPEQGHLMTLLTRLLDVQFAVEVGTFTGYSALCIALGLPASGRLLCCDVSEEWTAVARRHWQMAGVAERIDLRIAPALDTLRALPGDQSVDLAFIDADKTGYAAYYDELLPRLSPRGVIIVDNVLWSGRVLDNDNGEDDADTAALRAFNDYVSADRRSVAVMLPLADGLTLIRRAP